MSTKRLSASPKGRDPPSSAFYHLGYPGSGLARKPEAAGTLKYYHVYHNQIGVCHIHYPTVDSPKYSTPPACVRQALSAAQLPIETPGWPQGDQGHRSGRPRREPAALHTSGQAGSYKWRSMYLQREHGHPVAHVATDYMALNREHPALALHAGLALVAGGTVAVTGSSCPVHWLRISSPSLRAGAVLGPRQTKSGIRLR